MGLISINTISDGSTADAADVNSPLNTIVNEINGNIDNANIKSDAAIAGSKLADASITNAKLSTTAGELGGAWATWTPSPTGFSGTPTVVVANYTQIGKTVIMNLEITGTSNAATFGFTLPVAPKNADRWGAVRITDSGTVATTPGLVVLVAASTSATLGKNISAGAGFTASGTKACQIYGMTYEAA